MFYQISQPFTFSNSITSQTNKVIYQHKVSFSKATVDILLGIWFSNVISVMIHQAASNISPISVVYSNPTKKQKKRGINNWSIFTQKHKTTLLEEIQCRSLLSNVNPTKLLLT